MKKKKIIRFSIIIGIFLIIFGLVFLLNKDKIRRKIDSVEYKVDIIPYDMQAVNEYSSFFSVVNILNNYLNDINDEDTDTLLDILHIEYLEEYDINPNNLYDNIGNFSNILELSFKVKQMDYKIYEDNYLYYAKGDIIANNFEDNEVILSDVMFLVNIDYENVTYSIYPLDTLKNNLPIDNPLAKIIPNNHNELEGSNIITKDYICNLYLNDFINKVNNNVSDTYSLLNEDFRKRMYPHKDEYISYMNNNKDKLSSQIFSCNDLSESDHVYEIKDMNSNSYIFKEESIMNYKVEFTLQ